MLEWERIARGAVNVEVEPHLREAVGSGRKLRVKLGIDPSSPDIHLGHTVVLGKLRDFQDLGHTAVLIIGDFTARIGDPSGQSATRRPLEEEEVEANAATYLEQVFKVLDRDTTDVRRQSEWFMGMELADVIRLAGKATLAQIITRDDFRKRLEANTTIGLHELLYPLMQGYDSVAVRADVELGGTDQLFNLLFARDVQREHGLEPQDVLTTPLLEGLDGKQKMSKSLGNYVGVTDAPAAMYGKLMSLPDELITRYMRLVTDIPESEVAKWEAGMKAGGNPRDAKAALARMVVQRFHGETAASPAEEAFQAQFKRGEVPDEVEERALAEGDRTVADALVELGLASSKGEARRLATQRGVRLNGETVEDAEAPYQPSSGDLWQVGKRRFVKVVAPAERS
ncbi:MAG TPA: tyrosine--tRNA ligase [Candidatus Dormibacteraeota bacterium]|jgi:tyrosyl-tRNA synthetase|nr:tyrosine--tRNA ligase [Candidatus Dormibacteraeota bacterium]